MATTRLFADILLLLQHLLILLGALAGDDLDRDKLTVAGYENKPRQSRGFFISGGYF